ncbi:hypothetical protein ROZALSC1DRAFT_20571 [Rozella allomycis CSF55]|uniref:Uncharacterized protein n=1 Tax=Rozella allomycis (strain CSF55) TaxID=988480 RepID=A0A4P9YRQ5_ROZAC|nr:hypothetical protein ROZALSC1DRAFT_20571 [Rozella allomycis CSF55]
MMPETTFSPLRVEKKIELKREIQEQENPASKSQKMAEEIFPKKFSLKLDNEPLKMEDLNVIKRQHSLTNENVMKDNVENFRKENEIHSHTDDNKMKLDYKTSLNQKINEAELTESVNPIKEISETVNNETFLNKQRLNSFASQMETIDDTKSLLREVKSSIVAKGSEYDSSQVLIDKLDKIESIVTEGMRNMHIDMVRLFTQVNINLSKLGERMKGLEKK